MPRPSQEVLHITSWLSRVGGGIPPVINSLAGEMHRCGAKCVVAGLKDEFTDADCRGTPYPVLSGAILGPRALGFSPELERVLSGRISSDTVVHSHSIWMYPTFLGRKLASRAGAPLMISPHGMLEPWAINHSRWKKRLAAWAFENGNLRYARCLHALCRQEAQNFRAFGLKNPVATIPNGVDLELFDKTPAKDILGEQFPELKGTRRILFLSRIHPKKGLPNLIQAWKQAHQDFKDWRLVVAGPDEAGHEAELKALVESLGLTKNVHFVGPVYGANKASALANADIFVLPSFSEGFSMAILEAAASRLPILYTHQCNFPELAAREAGIEVAPEVVDLHNGLRELLSMSDQQRRDMGQRGRNLVEENYTWPRIAAKMMDVYAWMLDGGPVPDCIEAS